MVYLFPLSSNGSISFIPIIFIQPFEVIAPFKYLIATTPLLRKANKPQNLGLKSTIAA